MRDTQEHSRELAEETRDLAETLSIAAEEARAAAGEARAALGELKSLAAHVRATTQRQEELVARFEARLRGLGGTATWGPSFRLADMKETTSPVP